VAINCSGSMNLFLQARGDPANGSIPLFVYAGASGSATGVMGGIDLYLLAGSGYPSGSLNLFLQGPSRETVSGLLPLWLEGAYNTAAGGIELYLASSGASNSLTLFVKGSGVTAGAMPADGYLPLYIERLPTASLDLFLQGEGTALASGLTLFAAGNLPATGSLPLYLSGVGASSSSLTFYTRGF
jgi:hypothetical protein